MDGTLIDSNGIWKDVDIAFLKKRGFAYTRAYYEGVAHTIFPLAAKFTKEYWYVDCKDGRVRFVGNIIANPPMIAVDAVHWDDYVSEHCIHK